jgi:Recombination endonuclease VII
MTTFNHKEYHRQYQQDHKEDLALYQKEYREKNNDRIKEQKRKYYDKNKENILVKNKDYRDNRAPSHVIKKMRKNQWKVLLSKKYNITPEIYHQLEEQQDHRCAICKSDYIGKNKERWNIDHNHNTGEVRGLLCDKCNLGIGYLNDDVDILKSAIKYLTYHD